MGRKYLVISLVGAVCLLSGCVVAPVPSSAPYYGEPITVAPPPPRVEYVGPPPVAGYVWIGGAWDWAGSRYVWAPGRWEAPRQGYIWVSRRWEQGGRYWHQSGGYWSEDRRGGSRSRGWR